MSAHKGFCVIACLLAFSVGMLCGCANSLSGSSTIQITPTSAILVPEQKLQFSTVVDVPNPPQFLWQVNGVVGGSPSTGTITTDGVYTAPNTPTAQQIQISVRNQPATATVSIFDPNHPDPGSVAATQNPLVAAYTMPVPLGASVQVQFGTDKTYGQSTSIVTPPPAGGVVTVLVAGMRASTPYHMQATVKLPSGSPAVDNDHVFTTGAVPAGVIPNITTQEFGGATPSPGIELLSLDPDQGGNQLTALATDLSGNVIWYYAIGAGEWPFPLKLLPNGHMLVVASPMTNSQGDITPGGVNEIREIDLAGNIINRITIPEIDAGLQALGSTIQVESLHHDILPLSNGHFILLANYPQTVGTTLVLGDVLIDWDPQKGPVWYWSTFDHLDYSHNPYGTTDWTHGNAVIYSPDDGDLIFSMRNQNWIVKINYQDGRGDGSILWRFGPGGDFTLPGQEAPIEWNYGQHYVTIQSPNSSGIFSLMFFNNGNNRLMNSNNVMCSSPGVAACYSSVPVFELNEYTKTASVLWEDNLSPAYSICCGDALVLPSGNIEYDVAYDIFKPGVSYVQEIVPGTSPPQLIWQMNITGMLAYRALRIPSLYPGVDWTIPPPSASVEKAAATNSK